MSLSSNVAKGDVPLMPISFHELGERPKQKLQLRHVAVHPEEA
eukprot:CAMPEP_0202829364 /NCGR_PEP_ID=MMETSP1389-20130828/15469_1 /ASSEMBLY_ACC=CAM_ASM_000865 /TAXON_ID=302021 /ORGANISM="Rhodomonas sp., Strain CCMP768" /LENGTH=42 /DNA_ID= /DNA_START= /DNA_END= /DNA_ORIENTATION=